MVSGPFVLLAARMASRRLICPFGLVARFASPAIVMVAGFTSTTLSVVETLICAGVSRSSRTSHRGAQRYGTRDRPIFRRLRRVVKQPPNNLRIQNGALDIAVRRRIQSFIVTNLRRKMPPAACGDHEAGKSVRGTPPSPNRTIGGYPRRLPGGRANWWRLQERRTR